MVTMRSKKDIGTIFIYFLIVILGCCVLILGLSKLRIAEGWYEYTEGAFFSLIGIATPLAMLYALLRTKYVFNEKELELKSGLFKVTLAYADIFVIKDSRRFFALYSLSSDRFEITFKDKNNASKPWGHYYVSPLDKNEFIKELRKHCKHVKVVRAPGME